MVRRTKAEIRRDKVRLYEILAGSRPPSELTEGAEGPCSVRHTFYCAIDRGYVTKDRNSKGYEPGCSQVQRDLLAMRRDGEIPMSWITDGSRDVREKLTFDNPDEAREWLSRFYRRDRSVVLDADVYVWCEASGAADMIEEVTEEWCVPLMASVGFSSETYDVRLAERMRRAERPVFVYYLGDFDGSGQCAGNDVEAKLRRYAPEADITFVRLALTAAQISEWNLPTQPVKVNSHSKNFSSETSCQLEAIPRSRLVSLVADAIEAHVDWDALVRLEAEEEAEREGLEPPENDS